MKRIINLIVLTTLLLSVSLTVFAQEKTAVKQQFTNLKENAYSKLKNQTYRVKINSESYSDAKNSKPILFTSEISEYAPPDSSHTISERKTDKGVVREEQISIGQKKYIKQIDGSWRESPSVENRTVGGSAVAAVPIENEQNIEYFYKGKKNINNQTADLYEEKITRKYKNLNLETVLIKRYWFDQNGMFLKNETESKVNNKVDYSMILEYEYDPNIKIVAPKIN